MCSWITYDAVKVKPDQIPAQWERLLSREKCVDMYEPYNTLNILHLLKNTSFLHLNETFVVMLVWSCHWYILIKVLDHAEWKRAEEWGIFKISYFWDNFSFTLQNHRVQIKTFHHLKNLLPVKLMSSFCTPALLQILSILENKVVVGHSIYNDFKVLAMVHPVHLVRDTSTTRLFSRLAGSSQKRCSLKFLSHVLLNRQIQVTQTQLFGLFCSM